jgi:calcineurin-like phosphoesterase family protein
MNKNIWFTADQHFGHKNIIKYCKRPFKTIKEMNDVLMSNWNKLIKPGDTVYQVGDLAFCKNQYELEYIADQLNGKKNIILGNHDTKKWMLNSNKFESVSSNKLVKFDDIQIFLSHFAHRVWPKSHYGILHLFGHSHGGLEPWGLSFDIGVDVWDFKPLNLDEIIERMKVLQSRFDLNPQEQMNLKDWKTTVLDN